MPDTDTRPAPAPVRGRVPAYVPMTLLLVVVVTAGVLVARAAGAPEPAPPVPAATGQPASGPIVAGGPGLAGCVEFYDLTTLANRRLALDGTVVAAEGDAVTLDVSTWYRGGDTSQVTLRGASGLVGLNSSGDPVPLQPGTRLLVAGDDGFAWSCGFTQPYDDQVAQQWAQAFAGS